MVGPALKIFMLTDANSTLDRSLVDQRLCPKDALSIQPNLKSYCPETESREQRAQVLSWNRGPQHIPV